MLVVGTADKGVGRRTAETSSSRDTFERARAGCSLKSCAHADAKVVPIDYNDTAYYAVYTTEVNSTVPHWGVLRTAKEVTTTSELMCTSCESALPLCSADMRS